MPGRWCGQGASHRQGGRPSWWTRLWDRRLAMWAVYLLGVLTGASLAMLDAADRIDRLDLENARLTTQVAALEEDLRRLQESLSRRSRLLVRDIQLEILAGNGLPERLATDLAKETRALLVDLIGREVNELDPLLISRILQGRILTVAGSQWQLNVLHLVLGERVRVFLSIKPVEPPAKPGI